MSEDVPISKRPVLYELPEMHAVTVRQDHDLDLYLPPGSASGASLPAVVLVAGYPDPGFARVVGCRFKEMASTVTWARLIAATGMIAVASANREPAADAHALLAHLRRNADPLGIDASRIGLWASSGNAPVALSLLLADAPERVRCAALCYPFLLDLDGASAVADASAKFGFANPCAGRTVDDLRRDVPLFLVRAGQDPFPGLNASADRFVFHALSRNLPVTAANHPDGPHAFDLFHESETTRELIRQVLAFLRFHLVGSGGASTDR